VYPKVSGLRILQNSLRTFRDSVALVYELDDRGLESRQGLGIFLFTTVCRSALGPTHLLSKGYQAFFPRG
jgi:hypothetical protein